MISLNIQCYSINLTNFDDDRFAIHTFSILTLFAGIAIGVLAALDTGLDDAPEVNALLPLPVTIPVVLALGHQPASTIDAFEPALAFVR